MAQCLQGSHQNESPRSRHIHSCKARFHLRIGNAMHGIAYVRVKSDHPKRSLPISSSLLARTFHPQATMWYSSISHVPPLKKTDPLPKIQNETQHDIIRTSSQPYLVSLRFDGAVAVSSFANVFQNRRIRPPSTPRGFSLSRCVDLSSTGVGVHLLGDLSAFCSCSCFLCMYLNGGRM